MAIIIERQIPGGLDSLLAFIRGEGHPWGTGIRTYPDSEDAEARRKHADCLELERRGLVRRHYEGPGLVVWKPAEEK